MNKKIEQPLDETLVIVTIPFGSQVYGTAKVDSDQDYIKIIYGEDTEDILQWQGVINDIKVDYTYVTLNNFCTLVRNGGNIPMWEAALYCDFQVAGHDLNDFDWYKVIRGHIGLAKRDVAYYPERTKHVCKGLSFAHIMMQDMLPSLKDVKHIPILMNAPNLRSRIQIMRRELNKMYGKT